MKCWDKYRNYYIAILSVAAYFLLGLIPLKVCSYMCIKGYYNELLDEEIDAVMSPEESSLGSA